MLNHVKRNELYKFPKQDSELLPLMSSSPLDNGPAGCRWLFHYNHLPSYIHDYLYACHYYSFFFVCSSIFFCWLPCVETLLSKGNTATGAAGTVSQRSFRKVTNFLAISLRNSSSRVKRSKIRQAATYLNGTKSRMAAEENSTRATSVVIWYSFILGCQIFITI